MRTSLSDVKTSVKAIAECGDVLPRVNTDEEEDIVISSGWRGGTSFVVAVITEETLSAAGRVGVVNVVVVVVVKLPVD